MRTMEKAEGQTQLSSKSILWCENGIELSSLWNVKWKGIFSWICEVKLEKLVERTRVRKFSVVVSFARAHFCFMIFWFFYCSSLHDDWSAELRF